MIKFFKKSLLWIASGTVSVILTACYGPNVMRDCFSKVITVVDEDGKPIPGLEIRSEDFYTSDPVTTNSDGNVTLDFCVAEGEDLNIRISEKIYDDSNKEDPDEYVDKSVTIESSDDPETIVMESVE